MDGHLTQGENVPDNGGINEAFRTYQKSVAAQGPEGPLPGMENFTPEQMFFIGYAQVLFNSEIQSTMFFNILFLPFQAADDIRSMVIKTVISCMSS